MQIPRWRNLVLLRDTIIPSVSQSSASTRLTWFHSTPTTCGKSRDNIKPQIRISVRQNRADTKKALKNLLNRYSFQPASSNWAAEQINRKKSQAEQTICKKSQPRSSARHSGKSNKRMKSKFRRDSYSKDYDDHAERVFQSTFKNKWYSWSFRSWDKSSFQSSYEYEWRGHSRRTNNGKRGWETRSGTESYDESFFLGSCSDRKALDLPLTGPLKIEDVKNAFRLSALKWHPDKHQGPSQAMAEEKFKLCVNAYQSLCKALAV